mgnify:CR=1 FL=1
MLKTLLDIESALENYCDYSCKSSSCLSCIIDEQLFKIKNLHKKKNKELKLKKMTENKEVKDNLKEDISRYIKSSRLYDLNSEIFFLFSEAIRNYKNDNRIAINFYEFKENELLKDGNKFNYEKEVLNTLEDNLADIIIKFNEFMDVLNLDLAKLAKHIIIKYNSEELKNKQK